MRNIKKYIVGLLLASCLLTSCEDFLTREPLDAPAQGTFLKNEAAVNNALNALYRSMTWDFRLIPYQSGTDGWTDIAILRANDLGEGVFDTYNSHPATLWKAIYTSIQRANTILEEMEMYKSNMNSTNYERMRAEVKILRAWSYHYLVFMFGDAPLTTKTLKPEEFKTQVRTPKSEIVKFIYDELDGSTAPLGWLPTERGRVSKSVALGLKARTALYNKEYDIAKAAAKEVIDNAGLSLNPNYGNLFTRSGQQPNAGGEIMYEVIYTDQDAGSRTNLPLGNASRTAGAQSGRFPIQRLVDNFEASDGRRIDESTIYDPQQPSRNRDMRLKYTVALPGDTVNMNLLTFIYDIYNNTTRALVNNTWVSRTNADYDNAFGPAKSGVGYLWTKYTMTDENAFNSKVSFIFMRYAEILLIYAEASIESNMVDDLTIESLNKLRTRAKLPLVRSEVASNNTELKKLLRRERTSELAVEGFRWFDIRRWDIGGIAMPGVVVGISKEPTNLPGVPNFKKSALHDLNSIPDYTDQLETRYTRETRHWSDKLNLLPVPQAEIDINTNLTQNPGWE